MKKLETFQCRERDILNVHTLFAFGLLEIISK